MTCQDNFLSDFHALSGTTIKERRKNLKKLLSRNKSEQIDFASISPKTPLEELFKMECFLYFERNVDLLPLLRNGHRLVVIKALNCHRFMQEVSSQLTSDELVREILPQISHWAKNKLLGKLKLNEDKSQEFYQAVEDAYGFSLASKLLKSCSTTFIMDQFEKHPVDVMPRMLLKMVKSNPDLAEDIFAKLSRRKQKHVFALKYKYVFKRLVLDNPELFVKLYEIYNPEVQLGARTTHKFLLTQKAHVVQNARQFGKILNKKQIPKTLEEDFGQFYLNLLPKSLGDFQICLDDYLDYLTHTSSRSERLNLLKESFMSVYGTELFDQAELMTDKLIRTMDPDERELWMAKQSRPSKTSEETWISYMKPQNAIPLLKEKILLTSNKTQRCILIKALIDTCKINNDKAAMLEVCSYIVKKHRNEDFETRFDILAHLVETFKWRYLGEEYWVLIRELMRLVEVEAHYQPYCLEVMRANDFYRGCERGLDMEEMIKDGVQKYGTYFVRRCMENVRKPEYMKRCLVIFPKVIPLVFKKETELINAYVEYLSNVQAYNKRAKKDPLSYFSPLEPLNYLRIHLKQDSPSYETFNSLSNIIVQETDNAAGLGLIKEFLESNLHLYNSSFVEVLLKKSPISLLDSFIPALIEEDRTLNRIIAQYELYQHIDLSKSLSDKCFQILNLQDDEDHEILAKKLRAIRILGQFMPTKDFLSWTKSFQENTQDCSGNKFAETILKTLQFSKSSLDALEYVLKHLQEDELLPVASKVAVALASRLNEDDLLDVLQKSPTSSHTLKLTQLFLVKPLVVDLLVEMSGTTDPLLKRQCLEAAFKLFARNPDSVVWGLLKQIVGALDTDDSEAYVILTKFKHIPSSYFVDYVTFTWKTLDSIQNPTETCRVAKNKFLEAIDSQKVHLLSKEFILGILNRHFMVVGAEKLEEEVQDLACKYIIHHSYLQAAEERIETVMGFVKKFADSTWFDVKTSAGGRKVVFDFIKKFCSYFLNDEPANDVILVSFLSSWTKHLPRAVLDEHLYLEFTVLYVQALNNSWSMNELGQHLATLCSKLDQESLMNPKIVCRVLKLFHDKLVSINKDGDSNENFLQIAEGVLGHDSSICNCVVVLSLLPDNEALTSKVKRGIAEIVEKVLRKKDPLVQIHVNHYLTQNKCDMYWNSEIKG